MNSGYPDDEEKEARRQYLEEREKKWKEHKQPCSCPSCISMNRDLEDHFSDDC